MHTPVPPTDAAVTPEQQQWRDIRDHVRLHRAELSAVTAARHPEAVRVAGTSLLSAPQCLQRAFRCTGAIPRRSGMPAAWSWSSPSASSRPGHHTLVTALAVPADPHRPALIIRLEATAAALSEAIAGGLLERR
jgi:hypothetical protein